MKVAFAALLLLGTALPAAAQMPPPPPGETMPDGPGRPPHPGMRPNMFASMSEAGRATMMAAMRGPDHKTAHMAIKAARDRMLAVLDADRLDPVALRRAMDDEREAATAMKIKEQGGMLAAFQQLSLADRRAFVADARAMRSRMENRVSLRGRHGPDSVMQPALQ